MNSVEPDLAMRVMQAMLDNLRGLFATVVVEYETVAKLPQPCKRCGLLIEPGQTIQRVRFPHDPRLSDVTHWVHRDCPRVLEKFIGAASD